MQHLEILDLVVTKTACSAFISATDLRDMGSNFEGESHNSPSDFDREKNQT
jgi:hypothetical protein